MARLQGVTRTVTVTSSDELVFSTPERKAERLIVYSVISGRSNSVGKTSLDRDPIYQWSGRYSIIENNSIVSQAPITFQNQRLLNHLTEWDAEVITQEQLTELSVPDVDVNELIDELAVVTVFAGSGVRAALLSLNIPFLNTAISATVGFLDSFIEDDAYYFPWVTAPNSIKFDLPVGVSLEVSVTHFPFSPLIAGAGLGEVPIEPFITEPLGLPSLPPPDTDPILQSTPEVCELLGFDIPDPPPPGSWILRAVNAFIVPGGFVCGTTGQYQNIGFVEVAYPTEPTQIAVTAVTCPGEVTEGLIRFLEQDYVPPGTGTAPILHARPGAFELFQI